MSDDLTHDERMTDHQGQEGSGLLVVDGHTIPARFHPLAELFPMIGGEAFNALVEDVREHGVRRPIVLLDGMILDGRNRYMAAREAGATYRVVEFTGNDPVAYVVSENINRRHLTTSQRAMVAARIANLEVGSNQHVRRVKDPETGEVVGIPTGSQSGLAKVVNVSRDTVVQAAKVAAEGAPELIAAVASGEVRVAAAAEVAKLPQAEQVDIVSKGPEAVREAAKAVRRERATKPAAPAEPTTPVDPERRALAKMTTEGLIDEVVGLREENAELRKEVAALKAERDKLKTQLDDALSEDQGRVIGNLHKQLQAAKGKRDDALADAKRLEYRLKKAEARVKELENTPVEMGAP